MLFPVGPAERVCCKTGRASVVGLGAEFAWPQISLSRCECRALACRHQRRRTVNAYATSALAIDCGGRQMSLASLRRFCAIAVSSTSSFAPLKPRRRSRSSLWLPFMILRHSLGRILRMRMRPGNDDIPVLVAARPMKSSLPHSTVSPTLIMISAGGKARSLTCTTSAANSHAAEVRIRGSGL